MPADSAAAAAPEVFDGMAGLTDRCGPVRCVQNESAMNAEGIRRCVEEKEAVAAARDQLAAHAARLEKECGLYERDLKRAMESCDELAWESDDLRKRLRDAPDVSNTPFLAVT